MLAKIMQFFRSPWLLRRTLQWQRDVSVAIINGVQQKAIPVEVLIEAVMDPDDPVELVAMSVRDDKRHGAVYWFPHASLNDPEAHASLKRGIEHVAELWASRWADLWLQEAERWLEEQKESPQ